MIDNNNLVCEKSQTAIFSFECPIKVKSNFHLDSYNSIISLVEIAKGVHPVYIPNLEVKPLYAEST